MLTCVNKNSAEYQELASVFGDAITSFLFRKNGEVFPTVEEARSMLSPYISPIGDNKIEEFPIANTFSQEKYNSLANIANKMFGKVEVVSTPSPSLLYEGKINEKFLDYNEATLDQLLPLFKDRLSNFPSIIKKIEEYAGTDFFNKNSYEQESILQDIYYYNKEGYDYINRLISNQLKNEGIEPISDVMPEFLSSWIGEHSNIQYSITEDGEASIRRGAIGSIPYDEMSEEQKNINGNFNNTGEYFHPEGTDKSLTHKKMRKEDFVGDDWKYMEHIAKGTGYVERYVLVKPINGKYYVLHRVSDGKSNKLNKRKTELELKALDEATEIYRITGTALHEIKENALLKMFPKMDNSIYKELHEAINKNKYINQLSIDSIFKTHMMSLMASQQYIDIKNTYLNHPDCPLTDTITYKKKDGTFGTFTKKGNASSNYDKMLSSLLKNYIEFLATQTKIDWETNKDLEISEQKWNKAVFYPEKRVLDIEYDTVGTLDLAIIYSDGSASIFDYKFMKAKTILEVNMDGSYSEVLDVKGVEESYMRSKHEVYDDQISKYSDILKRVYGVTKIRSARIDPCYVKYTTNEANEVDNNSKVYTIYTNEEAYGVIPTQAERTGFDKVDLFLDAIEKQISQLTNRLSTTRTWSTDLNSVYRLSRLRRIMMDIQVSGNFESYFEYISQSAKRIEEMLSENLDTLDFNDINMAREELEFMNLFIVDSSSILAPFKEQYSDLYKNFNANLGRQSSQISNLLSKASDVALLKVKERALELGMKEGVFDRVETAEDVSSAAATTLGIRNINHPLAQTLSRAISESYTARIQFLNELEVRHQEVLNPLKEWGASQGLKGVEIFKKIINKSGNLITPYSEAYYKARHDHSNMMNSNNINWWKENFHRSTTSLNGLPSDEENFQKAKAEAIEKFKLITSGINKEDVKKEKYEAMLDEWLSRNDIYHERFNSWSRNSYYWSPKDPSKWFSKEYEFMMKPENEPLRKYYEFSIQMNQTFQKLLGSSIQIASNFIPNIRQEVIDEMSQGTYKPGAGALDAYQKVTGSVGRFWRDENKWKKKTTFGKNIYEIPEIPVMFIDGLNDDEKKSYDLGTNMMMFASFVNHYHHMKKIKDLGENLINIASKKELTAAVNDGKDTSNKNIIKILETTLNHYVHGEIGQDIISKTIGPKGVKVVDKILSETSRMAMTGNILSASAGFVNSQLQISYIASAGKYFTTSQWRKALVMGTTLDKKTVWASLFFGIHSSKISDRFYADGQSIYDIKKFNRHSIGMAFQHIFDNADDRVMMAAMMQNYGIDPETNQTVRLEKLREKYKDHEKYKDTEWLSILDSIKEVTVDGNDTYALINQHTGKPVEFSYLNPNENNNDNLKLISSFKRKVNQLGNMVRGVVSEDDYAGYSSTILGKTLSQFRKWMPGTFNARLKGPQYNDAMDEFEVGRWWGVASLIINQKQHMMKVLASAILPGATAGAGINDESLRKIYDDFISKNPSLKDIVSYDDFKKEYGGQVISLMREMMMFGAIGFLLLGMLMALKPDDDDEESFILNLLIKLVKRVTMEIGIFVPGAGIEEMFTMLSRDPFPMVRTFHTWFHFWTQMADEAKDAVIGENENDTKSFTKYLAKVGGAAPILNLFGGSEWVNEGNDLLDQDDSQEIKK